MVFTLNCKTKMSKVDKNISSSIAHTEAITERLTLMYDSIFAFQDVDWVTFKGIGEKSTTTTNLAYPFTVFCYKKDNIDLFVYNGDGNIVQRCVKSLFKKHDFSYCFYYSKDAKDTLAMCDYFLTSSKKISFVSNEKDFSMNQFGFEDFSLYFFDSSHTLNSLYFSLGYRKKKYLLEEILGQLENGNYPSEYDVLEVQHFQINGNTFYRTHDRRFDKEFPEENRENNKVIQYENLTTNSFFYHYINLFSYCKCFSA
jgi:hypothetical protein